jgi:O-antigen ligase
MQGRTNSIFDVALSALLLAAIPLLPLPWGGVLPGGKLAIQLVAFVALALAALGAERGVAPDSRHATRSATIPLALLAGVGILGLIQIIPLPGKALARLSPTSAVVHEAAAATLAVFDRSTPAPRISIAPTDTLLTALLAFAYVALFIASARAFHSRGRRRVFLAVLLATAIGQAVYASLTGESDRASGSFVNPNHLAGYLQIALAAAFGMILRAVLVGRDREHTTRDPMEKLYRRWTPVAWAAVAWAVVAIGIAITRSRGGIMMAAVTTLVLLATATLHGGGPHRRAVAATGGLAILGGLGVVAMTTGTWPLLRFLTSDPRDPEADMRVQLWQLSIDAWRNFPLLGSGLGSYREAFRRIQPEGMNALVEQAHNDGLQLLVTGGLVGFALAAAALAWLLVAFAKAFVRQRHREERAWALAGFGALLSLLLHGLVEFNFSIPAIPATLAMMLGCAWSAATEPE